MKLLPRFSHYRRTAWLINCSNSLRYSIFNKCFRKLKTLSGSKNQFYSQFSLRKLQRSTKHLPFQGQQWKHQKKVLRRQQLCSIVFIVDFGYTLHLFLVFLLLTLNRYMFAWEKRLMLSLQTDNVRFEVGTLWLLKSISLRLFSGCYWAIISCKESDYQFSSKTKSTTYVEGSVLKLSQYVLMIPMNLANLCTFFNSFARGSSVNSFFGFDDPPITIVL